jgi:acyl carrier protein
MTTSTATLDRVRTLLQERLGVPPEDVTADATFEQLDLDSLDLVEFALGAEDEFGVRISDEEAEDLQTIGEAIALLEAKGATVSS